MKYHSPGKINRTFPCFHVSACSNDQVKFCRTIFNLDATKRNTRKMSDNVKGLELLLLKYLDEKEV